MPAAPSPNDVVTFWRDAGHASWFRKDEAFDRDFRDRFLPLHEAAARGELDDWAATADGALALLILLDQFPRNAFRGTARMFATDSKALAIARTALDKGLDRQVDEPLQQFFRLPLMHSEDLADQELCVKLSQASGPDSLKWAVLHRDIVARFGRFPHRNPLLGRTTTAEEQRFLDEGGFAG